MKHLAPLAVALLAGSIFLAQPAPAGAGHTIQNGTCWKGGTPLLCELTWAGANAWLRVRLIDHYTDCCPGWYNAIWEGGPNWHAADGPQLMGWHAEPNDTWTFIENGYGNHPRVQNAIARSWNCDINSICNPSSAAIQIWWSEAWFNQAIYGSYAYSTRVQIFMHEIGHTLRLAHHMPWSECLMGINMNIQACDIGYNPPCGVAQAYWGVRCIYNYSGLPNKYLFGYW